MEDTDPMDSESAPSSQARVSAVEGLGDTASSKPSSEEMTARRKKSSASPNVQQQRKPKAKYKPLVFKDAADPVRMEDAGMVYDLVNVIKKLKIGVAATISNRETSSAPVTKEEGIDEETDEQLAALFGKFLSEKRRADDGNNGEEIFYAAQVEALKKLRSYTLVVDFMDLLTTKEYKKLAIRIGEKNEYGWLHGAVATFFHQNGMQKEDIVSLPQKVFISFTNKKRLRSLDDFMKSAERWRITQNNEVPLTEHGSRPFTLILSDLLDKHIKGLGYGGNFTKDDILLGEDFCWIYGDLLKNPGTVSCSADFSTVWKVMAPYYQVFEEEKVVYYPMNMIALHDTLTLQGLVLADVHSEWYRDFVRHHPTLASLEATRYFTLELQRLAKKEQSVSNAPFLTVVPSDIWQTWESGQSARYNVDWGTAFQSSQNAVLQGVYCYNPDQTKPKSNRGQRGQITSSSTTQINQTTTGVRTTYKNTVRSMVDFRRCIIVHGKQHAGTGYIIENKDSTEVLASQHLPNLLPYLLSTMLKQQLFANRLYSSLWISYKALFAVRQ